MLKKRVAVLASGGGTNLQALLDCQKHGVITAGEIALVIADRPGVYALNRAVQAGVKACVVDRKAADFEQQLLEILEEQRIDLIVLAGFLSILSADFTRRYLRRIINIHPSLIPAFCGDGFYGLRVHEAALRRGVKLSGATVHFVNEITDGGEIIAQKAVPVQEGDTPETLQQRIMEMAEWQLLPQAVQKICVEMGGMPMKNPGLYLRTNPYPGRGIYLGLSPDGTSAVIAYFIMGRSENSRNRVFQFGLTEEELAEVRQNPEKFHDPLFQSLATGLRTRAQDPAKLTDPSLVIYNAIRGCGKHTIVTNGDHTDTIFDKLAAGGAFKEALHTREYEPDEPNYTPRISGLLSIENGQVKYKLSILKKEGADCQRLFYEYTAAPGTGHLIHTYMGNGDPLPSFTGEPVLLACRDEISAFQHEIWDGLDKDNRVALHVRYIKLENGNGTTYTRDRFGGNHSAGYMPYET